MKIVFTCHTWAAEAAEREWRALNPGTQWLGWLHEGVGLIDVPDEFAHISQSCLERPLLFTRHIFPVLWEIPAGENPAALAADVLDRLDKGRSYSVQARAHDGDAPTRPLSDALREAGMMLDVRCPKQVISIYRAEKAQYVGVSVPEENLSAWNGGMMHFKAEGAVSRAEFKLLEALRTFPLDLSRAKEALDLGAAPGGWTRVLAQEYGMAVTAVDPAQLDERVAKLANVRHCRQTAREFMRENPNARFDLITNDMKMDARLSLAVMEDLRPALRESGVFLATLKLPERNMAQAVAEALRSVRDKNTLLFARQLFHNRNEATVIFRPR